MLFYFSPCLVEGGHGECCSTSRLVLVKADTENVVLTSRLDLLKADTENVVLRLALSC